MNKIEKAKDAILFTIKKDALEGYMLNPESVNRLLEALAALEAEKPKTFRRFEKRSGITTDVTDGGES